MFSSASPIPMMHERAPWLSRTHLAAAGIGFLVSRNLLIPFSSPGKSSSNHRKMRLESGNELVLVSPVQQIYPFEQPIALVKDSSASVVLVSPHHLVLSCSEIRTARAEANAFDRRSPSIRAVAPVFSPSTVCHADPSSTTRRDCRTAPPWFLRLGVPTLGRAVAPVRHRYSVRCRGVVPSRSGAPH